MAAQSRGVSAKCQRPSRSELLTDEQWQRIYGALCKARVNRKLLLEYRHEMRLDDYLVLMDPHRDLASKDYQDLFTSFYNVRRNKEWRAAYYKQLCKLSESTKPDIASIIEKLSKLHVKDGCTYVELSFASKMIATICPDQPLWDRRVKKALNKQGLRFRSLEAKNAETRKDNAIHNYHLLEAFYDRLNGTPLRDKWIEPFGKAFPDKAPLISEAKQIDFILWCLGD